MMTEVLYQNSLTRVEAALEQTQCMWKIQSMMSKFACVTSCSGSAVVSYSQSTDSEHEEHEEEQGVDVIQKKEQSFNNQQLNQNASPVPAHL